LEGDKVETLLSDMRAYMRAMVVNIVKAAASQVIDSYEKATVYDKLDGNSTQISLEQSTKVPQSTMSPWLTKFTEIGIAAPPGETHRGYRALFTLSELGINVSSLKKKAAKPTSQPMIVTASQGH